jgi:hypothetical protein
MPGLERALRPACITLAALADGLASADVLLRAVGEAAAAGAGCGVTLAFSGIGSSDKPAVTGLAGVTASPPSRSLAAFSKAFIKRLI